MRIEYIFNEERFIYEVDYVKAYQIISKWFVTNVLKGLESPAHKYLAREVIKSFLIELNAEAINAVLDDYIWLLRDELESDAYGEYLKDNQRSKHMIFTGKARNLPEWLKNYSQKNNLKTLGDLKKAIEGGL